MLKKVLSLITVFAVLLGLGTSLGSVQAKEYGSTIMTASQYIDYLEEQVELEKGQISLLSTDKKQSTAEVTLEKFKELSSSKQKKFLKYLYDEKVTTALLNAKTDGLKNGETVKLFGGDVEYVVESGIDKNEGIGIMASSWTVWHTFTATMFGVPVFKTESRGNYDYNSYGATKANWSDGSVLYNYNITTEIRKSGTNGPGSISSGRYAGTVYFSYKVAFGGYGPQIGERYHTVYGDEDGVDGGASGPR